MTTILAGRALPGDSSQPAIPVSLRPCAGGFRVKLVGMLLLLFGGAIAVAAVVLLRLPLERDCFVFAGIALEVLGLALAARDYAHTPRNVG